MALVKIPVDEVRLGMFIHLDVGWWKHPFVMNAFRVTADKQLKIIRGLKLKTVLYDPEKSIPEDEVEPQEQVQTQALLPPTVTVEVSPLSPEEQAVLKKKEKQLRFLEERRKKLARSEQEYSHAFTQAAKILKDLGRDKEAGVESARALTAQVVDTLLQDAETVVHLINLKENDSVTFFHSLNVCILSLILGRSLGLSKEDLNELGVGALFHDVGKQKIPQRIWLKNEPLTHAEAEYLQLHPKYGVSMLSGLSNVTPRVLSVVYQHHEKCNGKGYPQGLKEEKISRLARIASVVNVYDNITNNTNLVGFSFTPHEALSYLYKELKDELSREITEAFIKGLGVYPPGTIVQLSDGNLGMAITTDKEKTLRPTLILYDPNVPRETPIILDLSEEGDLKIVGSLRPSKVAPAAVAYLQPGRMLGFFVSDKKKPA
jgi:HD-GYP domain-containing protein (c-di-GMP phosphodiesterase class II)